MWILLKQEKMNKITKKTTKTGKQGEYKDKTTTRDTSKHNMNQRFNKS